MIVEVPSDVAPVVTLNVAVVVDDTLCGKAIVAGAVTVASFGAPFELNDKVPGNPTVEEPRTKATVMSYDVAQLRGTVWLDGESEIV